ncbi:MAG TPA: hypothetical protein VKF61_00335, partial [Candidatus Polarisedimenticolia bacterium]|nr:hypothetical protein [Candidatus Polarisedimenticolia bacterium]
MSTQAAASLAPSVYAPPAGLLGIARLSLALGAAAGVASLAGATIDPAQFFRSYLVAFVYWLSIPLGCSAIAMLHHMT